MYNYIDNRNYDYSSFESEEREEYKFIIEFIKPNSKVIDLGCGNGSLIKKLVEEKMLRYMGLMFPNLQLKFAERRDLKLIKARLINHLKLKMILLIILFAM